MGRIKKSIQNFKETIERKLFSSMLGLKWFLSMKLNIMKILDNSIITDPPLILRSEVFTSVNNANLDDILLEGDQVILP